MQEVERREGRVKIHLGLLKKDETVQTAKIYLLGLAAMGRIDEAEG